MPSKAAKNSPTSASSSEPVRRGDQQAKGARVEQLVQVLRRVQEVERRARRRGVHHQQLVAPGLVQLVELLHGHVLLRAGQGRGEALVEPVGEDALGLLVVARLALDDLVEGAAHVQHHRVQAARLPQLRPLAAHRPRLVGEHVQAEGLGQPPGRVDGEHAGAPPLLRAPQRHRRRRRGLADPAGAAAHHDAGRADDRLQRRGLPRRHRRASAPAGACLLLPALAAPRLDPSPVSPALVVPASLASGESARRAASVRTASGPVTPPVSSGSSTTGRPSSLVRSSLSRRRSRVTCRWRSRASSSSTLMASLSSCVPAPVAASSSGLGSLASAGRRLARLASRSAVTRLATTAPTGSSAARSAPVASIVSVTGSSSGRQVSTIAVRAGSSSRSLTRSAWWRIGPTRASSATVSGARRKGTTRPVGGASSTTRS